MTTTLPTRDEPARDPVDQLILSRVGLVRRIGRARLHRRDHVDDFVQTVVLALCGNRDGLRAARDPSKWVAGVAHNTAKMWNRRETRGNANVPAATAAPDMAPDDALLREERHALLASALARLDARDRALALAAHGEDGGYGSAQRASGLSYAAARQRAHRLRRGLRARLEGLLPGLAGVAATREQRRLGEMRTGGYRMSAALSVGATLLVVGGLVISAALADSRSDQLEWAPAPPSMMVELGVPAPGSRLSPADSDAVHTPASAPMLQPPAEGVGVWHHRASMPTGRGFFSSVVLDGHLYTIGGDNFVDGQWIAYADVERYDPGADTWSAVAPMSAPRTTESSSSVVDGKIYTMGGASHVGGVAQITEEYDPLIDEWRRVADMPTGRHSLTTAAVDGLIYAIGGAVNGQASAVVEVYDVAADAWSFGTPMPTPRMGPGAAMIDEIIYVIGGEGGGWLQGLEVTTVEAYDPALDSWVALADMPHPRMGFGTAVVAGLIYAVGGGGNGGQMSAVDIYDPATDEWTTGVGLDVATSFLTAHAIDGVIYTAGGFPNATGVLAFDTGMGADLSTRGVSPRGKLVIPWGALRR